jgi:chromosomal replication initiation ATPase DnaA
MLVEHLPIVQAVVSRAEARILAITGERYRVSIKPYPTNKQDEMLEYISYLVSNEFKVTEFAMKSSKRDQLSGLMDARHTFFYIAHKVVGFNSKVVGKYLNKDHSTVLVACTKIEGFLFTKDPIEAQIRNIISKIDL